MLKNVEAHQPPLRVPAESGTLDTESSQSFSQMPAVGSPVAVMMW